MTRRRRYRDDRKILTAFVEHLFDILKRLRPAGPRDGIGALGNAIAHRGQATMTIHLPQHRHIHAAAANSTSDHRCSQHCQNTQRPRERSLLSPAISASRASFIVTPSLWSQLLITPHGAPKLELRSKIDSADSSEAVSNESYTLRALFSCVRKSSISVVNALGETEDRGSDVEAHLTASVATATISGNTCGSASMDDKTASDRLIRRRRTCPCFFAPGSTPAASASAIVLAWSQTILILSGAAKAFVDVKRLRAVESIRRNGGVL